MPARIDSTLTQKLRSQLRSSQLLPAGARLGVAVSGGGDSVALLRLLHTLAPEWGWSLAVTHMNHGLRPEASEEQAFVRALARRLGLDCHVLRPRPRQPGENLEQWARQERLRGFYRLGRARQWAGVVTGHTLDDQAETVLLRLLRGAGTRGLSGIWPDAELNAADSIASKRPGAAPRLRLLRPLLGIARRELREYLRQLNQPWREDASNATLEPVRNRLRHQLIPQLQAEFNPALVPGLARVAEMMRDEEQEAVARATALAGRIWRVEQEGLCAATPELLALPPAMLRRQIRQAVLLWRGHLRGLDFDWFDTLKKWIYEAPRISRPRQLSRGGIQARVSARMVQLTLTSKTAFPDAFKAATPSRAKNSRSRVPDKGKDHV